MGISPKIGTPFVSGRGGVGGGVFIAGGATVAALAFFGFADDDDDVDVDVDAMGCNCFNGFVFAVCSVDAWTKLVAFGFVGFDSFGSLSAVAFLFVSFAVTVGMVAATGDTADFVLSIFRFFFFGLSSATDSDVLASLAGFNDFFFPFGLAVTSCSARFWKINLKLFQFSFVCCR